MLVTKTVCFFPAFLVRSFNRMHSLSVLMAALGIGWPLLSVWHPTVGFSSHSKDCWHSAGTLGETPTTNFRPPLQGPYRLLSCSCSLYSAVLYHLPLECSVRITPACASRMLCSGTQSIPAPSSIGAYAMQTPIPVISSITYRVLKLNAYKPDFSRSTTL